MVCFLYHSIDLQTGPVHHEASSASPVLDEERMIPGHWLGVSAMFPSVLCHIGG